MNIEKQISKLKQEFYEKKNSHIFLVETNNQEKSLESIKDLIKDTLSADKITKHQIDEGNYLELIIVRPDGKEIKKDTILALQNRLKVKPVLSEYIFYIIVNAELLNEISSNKLLKTIEEPNQNVIGFLISSNVDLLLPTIKSRCEYISLMYENINCNKFDENVHESVKKLIDALEKKDHLQFYLTKSHDQIYKENFKEVEKILKTYYNTACKLTKKSDLDNKLIDLIKSKNNYSSLIKKCRYLNNIFNKLTKNMNNDLLLEKIFLDFKDVK